jgi:gamma-aminobutyrate permease
MAGELEAISVPPTGADVYPGEPPAKLGQALRARHVSMIAIGGIIGAGLFVGSSTSIATAGPAVVLSYLLAGILVLLVMRMLSEMAVAIPGVQSFPEFARHGLGNWGGFLSGWLYWYFWVVVVAIEAIAGAVLLQNWIDLPTWLLGVALMAVLTAVNLTSTRFYGEFEFWFSSLKVAAIVAFIVIVAAYVFGFSPSPEPVFSNLYAHGGFAPNGATAVLAASTSVIFSLVGAEIATIAAAESAEPNKVVARMTTTVALRILIFYVLSVALIVIAVPWTQIVPGVSPFATVMDAIAIPGAATIMNLVVLVAVLSCLNSGLYVTSRVLFTLAAKGDAPQALVSVNRRKVPARAILVASVFSYVALAVSVVSPQVVFSFLVNASGALMLIIYLMLAVSQVRIRRRFEREAPERLTLRMWLFPWLSYATAGAIVLVLLAMALTPDLAPQFYSSLAATAVALIGYWLVYRKRGA